MRRGTRSLAWVAALVSIGAGAPSARAETIVTKRIAATTRLIPLRKITVGPDDQYSGVASPAGDTLVFTHKADLVPHLRRQDLKTGEASDLLPLTADSQEPSFSPDGHIAFSYYRFNARGDICYAEVPKAGGPPVNDTAIRCLKPAAGEAQFDRSNPFWRSATEIGYVVRDVSSQATRIVSENIKTGERQTLAEGKVFSPGMRPGGRYLVYSELGGGRDTAVRALKLKDLVSGQTRAIRFAMPGISGFPSISDDERYLYVSHYLDDTNHDSVIDGNDNSVVLRARLSDLLALPAGDAKGNEGSEYFPEQLTSIETNCSFPRPAGGVLYVSCAFEGALDVYQLPLDGVVPGDWSSAILDNAHQTSRTYAERLLLLNTMRFRQKAGAGGAMSDLLAQRLLANHLLSDDATAARYYVDRLGRSAQGESKGFYSLLGLYLEARERKKAQPTDEISRDFQKQILAIDARAAKIAAASRFRAIVRGSLRVFLDRPSEAASFAQSATIQSTARIPVETYLGFELQNWVLPRTRSGTALAQGMADAYRGMMQSAELTEESKLYYGFNYLKFLHETQALGDPGDRKARSRRLEAIGRAIQSLGTTSPKVVSLLQSEAVSLRLIEASDEAAKTKVYAELDQLMSASRGDYFLRKALYVRAIINFTEAAEFKYMDFVATNWIRYTQSSDTEFIRAREVYVEATLDRAYESWGKKNFQLAGNYFYGSLSLTDDLESHAGYLRAMAQRGQRKTIDERYDNLVKREFIDDNLKFVEAFLHLIDTEAADAEAMAKGERPVERFDFVIKKLAAMEQDRDSPVRYLLLGYCFQSKLLRKASGFEIDQELFQQAHRNLMLAYDLGRDNARIKAAVLMNLGILHARAQNHGLAAKFFGLRKQLGFVSSEEAGSFAWLNSRSLYFAHDPAGAADELADAPGDVPLPFVAPLLEREAFYRATAGDFEEAADLYQRLLRGGQGSNVRGDQNLAKIQLTYGWSLFRLNRPKEARMALMQALDHAAKLKPIPRGGTRAVDFEPVRIQLAAYGLLGREGMGTDVERLAAIEKRIELLPKAQKLFDTGYLPTLIQALQQSAALSSKSQPVQAASRMREALKRAEELVEADQSLSSAAFKAASNYMMFARGKGGAGSPGALSNDGGDERLGKVVEKCVKAYDAQKSPQPMLIYQKLRLKMQYAAHQALKSGRRGDAGLATELKTLAASDEAKPLKDLAPMQWRELQGLSSALAN